MMIDKQIDRQIQNNNNKYNGNDRQIQNNNNIYNDDNNDTWIDIINGELYQINQKQNCF